MAVTLDLEPDVEERLREKAAEKGLSVEGYLLTLIETLMREPETTARSKRPAFRRGLRLRPQKRDRMENLQEQAPICSLRRPLRRCGRSSPGSESRL